MGDKTMENKEKYEKANIEEINFGEDVITTSPVSVLVSGPGPMKEEEEENE